MTTLGIPMMGAITNSIWIQNDPKGMTLEFANDGAYWRSRMRALAWSTFYSFEWKLGPTGEAAVGHNGDHFFYDKGVLTNETGWVELVTTPVGGIRMDDRGGLSRQACCDEAGGQEPQSNFADDV